MHARIVDTLRVRDMDLHYAAQGEPCGPALILLHGYSDSWRSFEPLMDALPSHLRVIAFSMRGHGDSGKPASGYDIATLADDVVAALDGLGIGPAIVVGHSMGSLVARRIAIVHPARVSGLVLIGAFFSIADNACVQDLWTDAVANLRDPVDPSFVEAFQQSSVAVPPPPGFLATVIDESLKVPARVWKGLLRAMLDQDDADRLRRIAGPTLIIWGDQDAFAGRADQRLLTEAIPGARLVVHAGIGHAPHWEDATRAASDIVAFIDDRRVLAA